MEVDDEDQIYVQLFDRGLLVVCRLDVSLKLGCIGAVLMRLYWGISQ